MSSILSFLLTCSTVGAFVPSLQIIRERRRHFELFVGVTQLFSTLMFDLSSSLDMRLFGLSANDYHHVSDITTESYVCFLCIHLMGLRSEDALTCLRYLAFGLCWFAKLGDGWGSVTLETLAILLFAAPPLFLLLRSKLVKKEKLRPGSSEGAVPDSTWSGALRTASSRRLPYKQDVGIKALGLAGAGLALLLLENMAGAKGMNGAVLRGGAQVMFGGASWYIWETLPCFDKSDALPTFR
ncbi:hypothetical protein TeGR_g8684 [Tetraparma gracilis]|uniref:Uncharacterized protein n=1 Tax=Tetraparma gracilis TaxID=2962635 RepID=A0ABQ6N5Q2_9STRA|nr:hypothetical protein TeGR_g8684 [Tetraparma gracilis]